MKRTIIAILLLGVVMGIGNELFAQNEQLPADFPQYQNTGNPTQDIANYNDAKKQWIENNPQQYSQMQSGRHQIKLIDEKEFATMPSDKKAMIKTNSDKYQVGNITHPIDTAATKPTPLANPPTNAKHYLTKEQFQKAALEKQTFIQQHPEWYEIVE